MEIKEKLKNVAKNIKNKVVEIDKENPELKYGLASSICSCVITTGMWWYGYKYGCKETAYASVVYIRDNYPEAYKIIVSDKEA